MSPATAMAMATTSRAAAETYCVSCHGAQPQGNSFADILNAENLVAVGKVVPDDPENSPLYQRLSTNTMPPANSAKRPTQEDIDAMYTWIACGAEDWNDVGNQPIEFTDIDTRLEEILDDVRDLDDNERTDVRYIELYSLANSGFPEKTLEEYRQAISFTINSLSTGNRVVAPREIGSKRLLFRIELSDYGLDGEKWDDLTANYPYQVQYDPDSELFPFDEDTAEQIRDEIGEEIYVIQGDWFMANALIPPLYNRLLDLPADTLQLADQLGIDILGNIAAGEVDRSGFLGSGPSDANRIIERHEIDGNGGAFWISYDFANNLDEETNDIFTEPLNFTADGGEAIFNLPNGLQAYYVLAGDILDGAPGVSLDIAPINVVQDPASFDGQVINGLSCTNCHAVTGTLPKNDEIRDHVRSNGSEDLNEVLRLYPERSVMQELFEEDSNRYRSALSSLGIDTLTERTMHTVHQRHLDELTLEDVAAILGLEAEALEQALDSSIVQLPPSFAALRREDGTMDRDSIDADIGDLVEAIGLGSQIAPQNNNNN
jgi:hypothetical protein